MFFSLVILEEKNIEFNLQGQTVHYIAALRIKIIYTIFLF